MALIDTLIERIDDPGLRSRIADEVAKLVSRTQFGLVFQDHLPEDIEVRGIRPRRGDTVRKHGAAERENFIVAKTRNGCAEILPISLGGNLIDNAEASTIAYDQLVVVKDFSQPIYPGLREVERIDRGGNKPTQVVINGENYYALETLRYTHENKVDVIFIDPPYNTGSDDWLYNDKYIDKSDKYRHSMWLAFMDRRLRQAKRLLKDTGVIFVSIDDNEQAHLRMLMDQIFGGGNFVETIAVEMSTTSGPKVVNAQQGTIVKNVEFVHIFKKTDAFDKVQHTPLFDGVALWDGDYSLWLNDDGRILSFADVLFADPLVRIDIERFGFLNVKGRFVGMSCMDRLLAVSEATSNFVLENLDRIARRDIPPASCKGMDAPVRGWIEVEADHRTYVLTRLKSGTLNQVYTLARNYRMSDDYRPKFGRTVIRGDLWKGFYQDMGNIAKEGGVAFNNGKKPIRLLRQLIRWANNSTDAVIVDFFGGSGSTSHAVMEMNALDGGQRQSILITNNELAKSDDKRLRNAGHLPGDLEYDENGVFRAVTVPRLKSTVSGRKADGATVGAGYKENVSFFDLTYEDENLVALGRKFDAVAPLLWLKAGGRGPVIERISESGWALPSGANYGVLFDSSKAGDFGAAVLDAGDDLKHIYVVTDSEGEFQAILSLLGERARRLSATRLYSDYLRSFEINGKG